MTPDELVARHPTVFPPKIENDFDAGWYELVSKAAQAIEPIIARLPDEHRDKYWILGGKEKYAVLELYFKRPNAGYEKYDTKEQVPPEPGYDKAVCKAIDEVIDKARDLSRGICEICGKPGRTRFYGWQKTHCDEHYDPTQDEDYHEEDEPLDLDEEFGLVSETGAASRLLGMTIAFNTFVRRQTSDSPYTHWTLVDAELLGRIRAGTTRPSPTTEGVVLVDIDPTGFFAPDVDLQEGDRLVGEYKARRDGEEPRKSVYSDTDRGKVPAVAVDVVLYSHATLGKDATSDRDWEIVTINARTTTAVEPIHPDTLIANHFELDGGTATDLDAEEFVEALRESVLYWKSRALPKSLG